MVRTRSQGTYKTILTPSTKQPLDCVAAHCDSPQPPTLLQSDQASPEVHRAADTLFNDLIGMTADRQDIDYYKVALNLLLLMILCSRSRTI